MNMRPRVLQFGTSGQLGAELIRQSDNRGVAIKAVSSKDVNFTNLADISRAVADFPDLDVVINAAAYTGVDKAESQPALAMLVNAEAVNVLARACAAREVPLIHVSTDYVFDGRKPRPYVETDSTCPINVYGRTKLAGENAIRSNGTRHVILRTSWVYSVFGTNFVKTMLKLGAERDELRIVDDQFGAPTAATDLAVTILKIVQCLTTSFSAEHLGTFHYSGGGVTTWSGFAHRIFAQAREWSGAKAYVVPISTSEYLTPARRPQNSRLDCKKIEQVYAIHPVPWTEALDDVLQELKTTQRAPAR